MERVLGVGERRGEKEVFGFVLTRGL